MSVSRPWEVETEADVKRKIDAWIKRWMPLADVSKPAGGRWGKAGNSDYHLVWRGVSVKVEVKREGEAPTDLQRERLEKHRKAGGISASVAGTVQIGRLSVIRQMILDRTIGYVDP